MVLHALDVLSERLSISHGDIGVPFAEDSAAGHFEFLKVLVHKKSIKECGFRKLANRALQLFSREIAPGGRKKKWGAASESEGRSLFL